MENELEMLRDVIRALNNYDEGKITVLDLNDLIQKTRNEWNLLHNITVTPKKKEFGSNPLKKK